MKIITYNVNGIRAAINKGFNEWLKDENPDVICIQETKAQEEQVPVEIFHELGYHTYFYSAEKKGYSGVAIFCKQKPDNIVYGMDMPIYDSEGRFIRVDFGDLSVVSVYHPSGTSGDIRQDFKMQWLDFFNKYVNKLREERPNLLLCGDYNICHTEIDIHDPVRNAKNSGFLPEEREWVTEFLATGFIDSFRFFHPQDKDQYTWWSYRAAARKNNKGWRIDYCMSSEEMKDRLSDAYILADVVHSDHCPAVVILK